MERVALVILMATLALMPAVGIHPHEAKVCSRGYDEPIIVIGMKSPKTELKLMIPESVDEEEEFTIEVTVRCKKKGKGYDGKLEAFIGGVEELSAARSKDGDFEAYSDESKDILDEVVEKLKEMDPEDMEEAFESGEPIEVDTPSGWRYFVIYSLSERLLRVNDEDQTLELPLTAPEGPESCLAFILLHNLEKGEVNVSLRGEEIEIE